MALFVFKLVQNLQISLLKLVSTERFGFLHQVLQQLADKSH